jgi:uncharacterized heparinase superfamily protein
MTQTTKRKRILRLLDTIRHLKPRQALYWAIRRGLGRQYRVPAASGIELRSNVRLAAELPSFSTGQVGNEFEFLNVHHRFEEEIDWQGAVRSKLWQYNLHYFDYALDAGRSTEWMRATMQDWVRRNPPARSVGWEPYPVSLRIVNWIKFDLRPSDPKQLPEPCRRSLHRQLWWLERNLEHEIQANHLLKNAKALMWGGAYFAGADAERWLRRGLKLFLEQIEEQIRPDGGHYERSAMYHALVLQDMLDVLSLAIGSPDLISATATARLLQKSGDALSFLEDVTFPGGRLPMFNDSVAGIAPGIDELRTYAHAIHPSLGRITPAVALIDKPDIGLYGYRRDAEMLLIDGGGPSPSYQPGHSHCGLLGFELEVEGRHVIVDSGMHDYENGPLRDLLRSTAAHNTVRIDGEEQSDIWGAFRIGRRARAGAVKLATDLPKRFWFSGSHDGYRRQAGRPVHQRTIECQIGHRWEVVDVVVGQDSHLIESFLHFHPSFRLEGQGDSWIATCEESQLRFRISTTGGTCERLPSTHCPRFGVQNSNVMLVLSVHASLPARMTYMIEKL